MSEMLQAYFDDEIAAMKLTDEEADNIARLIDEAYEAGIVDGLIA